MNTADSIAGFDELLGKFKALADQKMDTESQDGSTQGLENFKQLLKKFERLPQTTWPKPRTLLEIAEFPHWELAHSNILAFFLDPNEEHGLGDLFLRSLLEAYGDDVSHLSWRPGSVKVKREDRTDANKSIDIVVESDAFVVGIENKIYAASGYNPYGDYWKRLSQRTKKTRKKVLGILLSLNKEIPQEHHCGFQPITYEDLFSKLRINGCNSRYPGLP